MQLNWRAALALSANLTHTDTSMQITTGRPVTMAPNGMVTCPHSLASQAGVDALRAGGSAVDAAIAASSALAAPLLGSGLAFTPLLGSGLAFILFSAEKLRPTQKLSQ